MLGKHRDKIQIFSTHNLLCRKFASVFQTFLGNLQCLLEKTFCFTYFFNPGHCSMPAFQFTKPLYVCLLCLLVMHRFVSLLVLLQCCVCSDSSIGITALIICVWLPHFLFFCFIVLMPPCIFLLSPPSGSYSYTSWA